MGSACSTEPSEVIGATNEKVEEPAVTQVVDTEVYKDVFEDDNDEVDNLVQTLTASIKVDRKLQRIRLASYEAVNKVILMLDTWLSILEDVEELDLVHAHFVAMKSMVTTCSKHCFDSLDSHVLISLYQSAILTFCVAIEKYASFRVNGQPIYTNDMHKLAVPHSIVNLRNDLVHGSRVKPDKSDHFYQAIKSVRWLFTYFWSNLSVERDDDGQKYLLYKMNFPKMQIVNQQIRVKIDLSPLASIDEISDKGEEEFDDGLSYTSRASSKAVSDAEEE